jgi:methionyl-tRNA synthetase
MKGSKMRAIPFDQDGDYTRWDSVVRGNADLVTGLGNLVQRATALARGSAGVGRTRASPAEGEERLRAHAAALPRQVATAIERLGYTRRSALSAAFLVLCDGPGWEYAG